MKRRDSILDTIDPRIVNRLGIIIGRLPPEARPALVEAVGALASALFDNHGRCRLTMPNAVTSRADADGFDGGAW